jgi:hypothetical protein
MLFKTLTAAAIMAVSTVAFAAKPTSITFEAEKTTADGTAYSSYIVKCSNGQQLPLTAWDNRKKWCVGKDSQEDCHTKQIRAAKQACR